MVGSAGCAAEGCAQCALDYHGRAGFGVPSTFGGVIPTPAMDRIANEGLRYNRMFSTALCSPTRAGLITGQNHHSAGFGVISEQATGYPGYNSILEPDKATMDGSCATTATVRPGSARTTTRRPSRRAKAAPSTGGRTAWASNIFMASMAAMPTSGSRTPSATRRRSIRSKASRRVPGTWSPRWRTTQSTTWRACTRSNRTSRFSSICPRGDARAAPPDEGMSGQD